MSDQFIPHGCRFDDDAVGLLGLQQGIQLPQQMATLSYQDGSDSGSQYSASTNSLDDQSTLSGLESPYEGSPFEELAGFNVNPIPHLSFPAIAPQRPNSLLTNIPTELHLLIFFHLDPLDSTCLGLTNAHFYNLHNTFNGSVPISTHRRGRTWEPHGKQKCCHCGTPKCQLHMHLRDWMPEKYEYCAIRQIHGLKAEENARKGSGYRNSPLKPERCGRHPVARRVHFDE